MTPILDQATPGVKAGPGTVRPRTPTRDQTPGPWVLRKPLAAIDARQQDIPNHFRRMLDILEWCWRTKCYCWTSNEELAEAYGCQRRNVQKLLKAMEADGYLRRVEKTTGRPGRVGIIALRRYDPDLPVADPGELDQVEALLRRAVDFQRETRGRAARPLFDPPRTSASAPMRTSSGAPSWAHWRTSGIKTEGNQDEGEEPTLNVGASGSSPEPDPTPILPLGTAGRDMPPEGPEADRRAEASPPPEAAPPAAAAVAPADLEAAAALRTRLRDRGIALTLTDDGRPFWWNLHPKSVSNPSESELAELRRLRGPLLALLKGTGPEGRSGPPGSRRPSREDLAEARDLIFRVGADPSATARGRLEALILALPDGPEAAPEVPETTRATVRTIVANLARGPGDPEALAPESVAEILGQAARKDHPRRWFIAAVARHAVGVKDARRLRHG